MKPYSIPFTGLKYGSHDFTFTIDDTFFAEFEYSLVKKGRLSCNVKLDKQETMLIMDFHITGNIALSCDRCLAEFIHPVNVQEQQIAKFGTGETGDDDPDEIITLGKNDTDIDISPMIYELVNISVPFISTCGNEGNTPFCDKSMLEKLDELSAEKGPAATDPRWDALKNLK